MKTWHRFSTSEPRFHATVNFLRSRGRSSRSKVLSENVGPTCYTLAQPGGLRRCALSHIGVGDGAAGGHVPPKIREKYFSGNY